MNIIKINIMLNFFYYNSNLIIFNNYIYIYIYIYIYNVKVKGEKKVEEEIFEKK